ncbi:MAG TPA: family 10 glycosylhydrolase [Lacunisphaera sp.]|nr:family 10 glycosylhydrolase [Lacunisphaera sp.]
MKPIDRRDFVRTTLAGAAALGLVRTTARAAGAPDGAEEGDASPPAPSPGGIVRADLSRATPAAALTRDFAPGKWQLVDFETVEGVNGTMASALPDADCATLTLPLEVEGPHHVYLAFNHTNSPYPDFSSHGQLDVRLSGDPGFRRVAAEAAGLEGQPLFKSVQEIFWRTADLTGRALEFRQPQPPYRWPREAGIATLCYVRLVPAAAAEVRDWEESQPRAGTRSLAMIYCTAQLSGSTDGTRTFQPRSEQWFADDFQAYRGTDVGVFIFEALRGNYCLYHSRIGDVGPEGNRWGDDWVDPLAAFTRLAHADGMKILAALRMIGPQYPLNRAPIGAARPYWAHPEWTKRDRQGRPVGNLSLAYPGVRQYWLALLRETLAYGVDGLQLHLNRGTPFVLYEEPAVRDFIARHGIDPRQLPEHDPRWLAHAAGYTTQFVREVRALVNEVPGRQLGVTVFGPTKSRPGDEHYSDKSYVCDVETWLREGLVDYVIPSQRIDLGVLRRWRELAGDRVHLWPDLMPRSQPPADYVALARRYREAGADGFGLWDGERRHARLTQWEAVRQLGHVDRYPRIVAAAAGHFRSVPLATLGGLSAQDSFRDG